MFKVFLVVVLSGAFAVMRALIPAHGVSREDVFKDMAHIWIGILIGAWFTLRSYKPLDGHLRRLYGWLIVFLIVVELVFALGGRFLF